MGILGRNYTSSDFGGVIFVSNNCLQGAKPAAAALLFLRAGGVQRNKQQQPQSAIRGFAASAERPRGPRASGINNNSQGPVAKMRSSPETGLPVTEMLIGGTGNRAG